ncbi:MAG: nitroreductase family protein [Oscillospiraceae bacterium]
MDFLTVMEQRRSCRAYEAKPVAREDLLKIVEAGRLTPSACNSQPWRFIVVDEPEAKERLCDALVTDSGLCSCAWRDQVPAFIALCEQEARIIPRAAAYFGTTQRFAQGDIGAAAMNMCHEAMDLGLGTCIIGTVDQKKMERHFGVPAGCEVRLVIAVGYAAEAPETAKVRKPLEEVCGFNRW